MREIHPRAVRMQLQRALYHCWTKSHSCHLRAGILNCMQWGKGGRGGLFQWRMGAMLFAWRMARLFERRTRHIPAFLCFSDLRLHHQGKGIHGGLTLSASSSSSSQIELRSPQCRNKSRQNDAVQAQP